MCGKITEVRLYMFRFRVPTTLLNIETPIPLCKNCRALLEKIIKKLNEVNVLDRGADERGKMQMLW